MMQLCYRVFGACGATIDGSSRLPLKLRTHSGEIYTKGRAEWFFELYARVEEKVGLFHL